MDHIKSDGLQKLFKPRAMICWYLVGKHESINPPPTHRLLLCRRVIPALNGGGHSSAARLDVFEGDGRAKVVLAARPNFKDRGQLIFPNLLRIFLSFSVS